VDVILLQKLRNFGALGQVVKVKPGFARNFLIPQGKAVYATKANREKFEATRAEIEKAANERLQAAVAKQQLINALPTIAIASKAGEEGKLFGSVGTRDIVDAMKKAGIEVEKRDVCLPEGPLRTLGEHAVTVELEADVEAVVKINIIPLE
jgi:large subunit ribosomal protein L9